MNITMKITPLGDFKFVIQLIANGEKYIGNPIIVADDLFIDRRFVGDEIATQLQSGKTIYLELIPKS